MIEWSEEQLIALNAIRKFVQSEVAPHVDALDRGEMLPYEIIRNIYRTFGIDEVRREKFERSIECDEAIEHGTNPPEYPDDEFEDIGMEQLLSIELCKYASGIVTAMGVTQLAAGAILSQGTVAQKKRWGLDLLTGNKIGSWAITEPGSGSDAFGGMSSTAKIDQDGNYVLNGSKTFITNGPYADTIVFICKLFENNIEPRKRKILTFVLDSGMPGLEQSKRLKKMGLHCSPTGQLFLDNVVVGTDRLLGHGKSKKVNHLKKSDPKATFAAERVGVVSMSLGIVERCLELCVDYAKKRVQWQKPIGDYQLIQLKLASMEVARLNIQNMLFNYLERKQKGVPMTFAEASAMKLYSTQAAVEVASEAIQLFGGNGYMSEYQVEQLYRDARVMRIYGGTDEIQVRAIAKDLLSR